MLPSPSHSDPHNHNPNRNRNRNLPLNSVLILDRSRFQHIVEASLSPGEPSLFEILCSLRCLPFLFFIPFRKLLFGFRAPPR
jgi:hypothetical protein